MGQIQITDSTFYNSSSINCCKPSGIQNTLFLGWWRKWQSIKGNEPADLSSLSQSEITMHSSKWKRKRSYIRKKDWKEIHSDGKFLCWEYAYFLFYFFKINTYYSAIWKKKKTGWFKRQITGLKLFDNKLMGNFKVLSACHLHQKKKLIGEGKGFFNINSSHFEFKQKRIHLIVLRWLNHRQF